LFRPIQILIFAFLLLCSWQCTRHQYITETDMRELLPDTVNGETTTQSELKSRAFFNHVVKNTVGKEIPPVMVTDLKGNKRNLQQLISGKTLLLASSIHCGFGMEGLENDFPKAIRKIRGKHPDFSVICLLVKDSTDIISPMEFTGKMKSLANLYPSIYWISERDAFRMNLFANPTRMIVNADQVVTHIGFGINVMSSCAEYLEKELAEKH
jgi:hypothetical protein